MRDPIDDFQFKPLTEGLGFHKKNKVDSRSSVDPRPSLNSGLSASLNSSLNPKVASLEMLETPLPRKEKVSNERGVKRSSVDDILKTLSERRKLTIKEEKKKPEPKKWTTSTWQLQAGLLDMMLITALILTSLIGFLLVSKADLFANLANPDQDGMIYTSLATLFVGFAWIYLVASRIFMACTPGEWISDQRMGRPEEFGSALYQIKVVFRSLLVVATGFVVFPFLSLIFKKDILGKITGLELIKIN